MVGRDVDSFPKTISTECTFKIKYGKSMLQKYIKCVCTKLPGQNIGHGASFNYPF